MGEDAVDELLKAAHMMSPDEETQAGFTEMVRELRASNLGHSIIEDVLLNTMLRGKVRGEWPRMGGG